MAYRQSFEDRLPPPLRVGKNSDCKLIAAAIERRVYDYQDVKIEAVGPFSVNQATKSVAVACTNLEQEGEGLAVFPEFIHIPSREAGEQERSAMQLYVFSTPPLRQLIPRGKDEVSPLLKVSQKSEAKTLATTIAARLRTSGIVMLQAVGPASVNQAVKAVAIMRQTMTEGSDVAAIPEFVHIPGPTPTDGERSAIRLTLFFLSEKLRRRDRRRDDRYERRYDRESERYYRDDRYDGGYYERDYREDRGPRNFRPVRVERDREHPRFDRNQGSSRINNVEKNRSPTRQNEVRAERNENRPPRNARGPIAEPSIPPYRPVEPKNTKELKVAAKSDAKSIAGAVILRLRQGDPVRITVMGADGVNQMIKAIAVARTYLEEDHVDIATYINFTQIPSAKEGETERKALQAVLYLSPEHRFESKEFTEFKVAAETKPKATAGAISGAIRTGKPCKLEALGSVAVSQSVKAIAIGRFNLTENDLDIFVVPQFRTLYLENGRRSALEIFVVAVPKP